MLVLSRRPHEKILIPAIQACIHVAAIQPGVVRVAIEAPREVAILRGELQDPATPLVPPPARQESPEQPRDQAADDRPRRRGRRMSKRLGALSAGLGLARLQLRAGLTRDAQEALAGIHDEIQGLLRRLEGKQVKSPGPAACRPAPGVPAAKNRGTRQRRLVASIC